MVLDASLVSTQYHKVRIKGKVEESRERSSYRKGSFGVILDYGRQLYFIYIYIYIYIRGAYDKFPDFFRMSTFIDSTRMKL